jgi:hypothetical protein
MGVDDVRRLGLSQDKTDRRRLGPIERDKVGCGLTA